MSIFNFLLGNNPPNLRRPNDNVQPDDNEHPNNYFPQGTDEEIYDTSFKMHGDDDDDDFDDDDDDFDDD